jgi:DNA repair exonuclease SbcCD ATPase subunit
MGNEVLQQIRDEMERAYRPPEADIRVERAEAEEPLSVESAALRSALSALQASYAMVGRLPPEPPTVRGRIGARLIKLVQRMLFWYTPQIVYFQYSALRALEEQAKTLERAERRIRKLESELGEERAENQNLRRAWEDLKVAIAAIASNSETLAGTDFVRRMRALETGGGDAGAAGRGP